MLERRSVRPFSVLIVWARGLWALKFHDLYQHM